MSSFETTQKEICENLSDGLIIRNKYGDSAREFFTDLRSGHGMSIGNELNDPFMANRLRMDTTSTANTLRYVS